MAKDSMYRTVGWIYQCKRLLDMKYGERPMVSFMRENYNGKSLTGAEIGVWKGHNALNMLNILSIDKLYLIDPYLVYVQDGESIDYSAGYIIAKNRLSEHLNNIKFIKKSSEDAVKEIPSDLDFVYIDGNHSYESVKQDIDLYYPKIGMGGVLGGHDFGFTFTGLMKAVIEFVEENDLELIGSKTDWWVIKN